MLVQAAVVVLLTTAPALVQAAPMRISSGISTGLTALKNLHHTKHLNEFKGGSAIKKIIGAKPTNKAKKHPGLKINTGARKSMSPIGFGSGTPYSGRYTPSPYSGRQMASPYGGGYVSPYTPSYSYASPTSYGGYPYSPQPMASPYSYVRRDTILSPRSELSPRALTSPYIPMSALGRATIGLPGHVGEGLPSKLMRKGAHYRKPTAIHRNYGNDLEMLERMLEEAEKVVNGLEEQLNKPKTMFPELEAVKSKIKKMHTVKMSAAKPATPPAAPAIPAKSA